MLVFRPFRAKTFVVAHHQIRPNIQRELYQSIDLSQCNFAMKKAGLQKIKFKKKTLNPLCLTISQI